MKITAKTGGKEESVDAVYKVEANQVQSTLKLPDREEKKEPFTIKKLSEEELVLDMEKGRSVSSSGKVIFNPAGKRGLEKRVRSRAGWLLTPFLHPFTSPLVSPLFASPLRAAVAGIACFCSTFDPHRSGCTETSAAPNSFSRSRFV